VRTKLHIARNKWAFIRVVMDSDSQRERSFPRPGNVVTPVIKVRLHRGGLQESMETMKEFETAEECREFFHGACGQKDIESSFYCESDDRIGWKPVYMVFNKYGPIGFSDREI